MTTPPAAAVWVSPSRHGGEPCVYGHRLPTLLVAHMVWRDGVEAARGTWELSRAEVIGACWYEGTHGSKKWRKRWGEWAAGVGWNLDRAASPPERA